MGRVQQLVAVLMVLISLGLGWYAWVLGNRSLTEKPAAVQAPRLNVVVATRPIPAGVPIAKDAVKIEPMTVRPEGAFDNVAAVEGRIPAENIVAGEAILAQRIFGTEKGIVSAILPGERAVAVKVDEVVAVGNRLNPSDAVDVFVIMRRNSDEIAESQSRLLLSGVRVLAIGTRSVQGRDTNVGKLPEATVPPRTVVLAVPSNQVSRLALAAETGKILLALRNPEDQVPPLAQPAGAASEAGITGTVTLRQLASGRPVTAATTSRKVGAATEKGVEVIRGLRQQQVGGSWAQ